MTLNSVDAAFIQNIAMSFAAILWAEYADKLLAEGKPSDINQKPIGTGPFVFKSYQKDSNIRYTGNKQYWAPERVKLDNLIFAINTDASVRGCRNSRPTSARLPCTRALPMSPR